jgi:NADPH:quinone reductase-like Zn-dependent oxidoreductase
MRAMIYRSYGGPEALESVDLPRPSPGPGQALVRVIASSVNPVDWKLASGSLRLFMPITLPFVPGFDLAGDIVELGPGVPDYRVGDRVHARIATNGGSGASAEFALVGLDVMAKAPDGMDPAEAAGLPLAGLTALQGLRDQAGLRLEGASGRVLVVGASGGVGHIAVQIARAAGAEVVGVCSKRNLDFVSSLGAHAVIDYNAPDPYAGQARFDIVFDCIGPTPFRWLRRLARGGRYVTPMPGPGVFLRSFLNPVTSKQVRAVMLRSSASDLGILDRLVDAGKLRVAIDSRYALADLRSAWERSRSGRTVGKIVIDVGELETGPKSK